MPSKDKQHRPEAEVPNEGASVPTRSSVARSTLLMTIGTLLSRATGLARTWMMAYALGAGILASSYQVANNLPNIIYETVAGGMIAAAFLPVLLTVAERRGSEGESRYASNIINIVAIVLGAISILGIAFAEPLIATQTFTVDGTGNEVVSRAVWLFRIFSIQILFYGLSGILQGMLNAHRTFFVTAIAPGMNNIVQIASLALYALMAPDAPDAALVVLAVGTTLGVIVQFAIQIPSVVRHGFVWRPVLDLTDPALRETLRIAVPTVIFVIASVAGQSARNAFSLAASDSGPALIQYAWLWFQLPYGVVAVSLARTLFTEMSDAAAKDDMPSVCSLASRGLVQTLCLMLPCAACLIALATPLAMVFQSGAFTAQDTESVAGILAIWALGLPFFSVWSYLYNAFASVRRFTPFALLNVALTAFQVALYAALVPTGLGIFGIPVADIIYYAAYAVLSWVLFKRVVRAIERKGTAGGGVSLDVAEPVREGEEVTESGIDAEDRVPWGDAAKMVAVAAVGIVVMTFVRWIMPQPDSAVSAVGVCAAAGLIGLVIMIGCGYATGVGSIRSLLRGRRGSK